MENSQAAETAGPAGNAGPTERRQRNLRVHPDMLGPLRPFLDATFICERGLILEIRQADAVYLGAKSPGELIGVAFVDMVPPAQAVALEDLLLLRKVATEPMAMPLILRDGTERLAELAVHPARELGGGRCLVLVRDISDTKLKQKNMTGFEGLVENSLHLMVLCRGHIIQYINRSGIKMLGGRSQDEFLGRPVWTMFCGVYREVLADDPDVILEGDESFNLQLDMRGGEPLDAAVKVTVMPSTADEVEYLFQARDIGAQNRAVSALHGANQGLERKVRERTTDLEAAMSGLTRAKEEAESAARAFREKSAQVTNLMDNSGQGFLSFGSDLVVGAECSRACNGMLGQSPAGRDVATLLFPDDEQKRTLISTGVKMISESSDPLQCELFLSLLPSDTERGDVRLKVEYKILDDGHIMVVLTDITHEWQLSENLRTEHRHLQMVVTAVTESRDFFDTVDAFHDFAETDLPAMLKSSLCPLDLVQILYRTVHTYKGLLGQFNFSTAPAALHRLEGQLASLRLLGPALTGQAIAEVMIPQKIQSLLQEDLDSLSDILGEEFLTRGQTITLTAKQLTDFEKLASHLLLGQPLDAVRGDLQRLVAELRDQRSISLKDVLLGFDRLCQEVATRTHKELAPIIVEGVVDVRLDPARYRPFLRALVHIFRNAVVHGIEDPDTRIWSGKEESGHIKCSIALKDDAVTLIVADDGAGIDVDALRQLETERSLRSAKSIAALSDERIIDMIFRDYVSTSETADEFSGRGVGLAAVRAEVEKIGGCVTVRTEKGIGTEFICHFPLNAVQSFVPGLSKKHLISALELLIDETRHYFAEEIGLDCVDSGQATEDAGTIVLHDQTVIIRIDQPTLSIKMVAAFSFDNALARTLFDRVTADIEIPEDDTELYRRAALFEIVNIVVGLWTMRVPPSAQPVLLSPPDLIEPSCALWQKESQMFHSRPLRTAQGCFTVNLIGSHAADPPL